jgi:hypothetical protein
MHKELIQKYRLLYDAVQEERKGLEAGHGFFHDISVAHTALLIAPNEKTSELAWISAMLHSTDHYVYTLQQETFSKEEMIKKVIEKHLLLTDITDNEKALVIHAVLNHWKIPEEGRSEVLQTLQEADMLANLTLDVVIRGGQYRPNIPAIEINHIESQNPLSTYSKPRSVFDAVRITLKDYESKILLPKAISLFQERSADLTWYIDATKRQYRDISIV